MLHGLIFISCRQHTGHLRKVSRKPVMLTETHASFIEELDSTRSSGHCQYRPLEARYLDGLLFYLWISQEPSAET